MILPSGWRARKLSKNDAASTQQFNKTKTTNLLIKKNDSNAIIILLLFLYKTKSSTKKKTKHDYDERQSKLETENRRERTVRRKRVLFENKSEHLGAHLRENMQRCTQEARQRVCYLHTYTWRYRHYALVSHPHLHARPAHTTRFLWSTSPNKTDTNRSIIHIPCNLKEIKR